MPLYRAFLQTLGAAALLALALACGGKETNTTQTPASVDVTISGKVSYQRVPLVKDAQGVPTGLADPTVVANLQTLPARGVTVRVFQQIEQTAPDGTKTPVWILVRRGLTDVLGQYSLPVPKDRPTMVEVLSSFNDFNEKDQVVNVVAEPGGVDSLTVALDRLNYALRKAPNGAAPAGNNTPSSTMTADTTLDFAVGLSDAWWLVNPVITLSNSQAPLLGQAVLETTIPGRTAGLGSGSRILAIGDTVVSFVTLYGSATPGTTLDLHYWPGRSEPRGSFVEYDRSVFPQAYDSYTNKVHFFASLRGGTTNDDAWDEGVILPLLARNLLFAGNSSRWFSVPLNPLIPTGTPLVDLSPDLARIEGLADTMAANLMKSPYLADTQGTGLASPVIDIRDISGLGTAGLSPYSAPAIRAMGWEVILKANGLPSPGGVADWNTIKPAAATRFFQVPSISALTGGIEAEPLNIYSQLNRLQEPKGNLEPVDLASIFTNAALTPLLAPFGLTWPRPATGPESAFSTSWGTDPNSPITPLAPMTFSMSKAVQVGGTYPNVSQGEVVYAGFSLNTDKRYVISAVIAPALNPSAEVELALPYLPRSFVFTGAGGNTGALVIPMSGTAPIFHPVRIRLKSPASIQPDTTVTIAFTPAP